MRSSVVTHTVLSTAASEPPFHRHPDAGVGILVEKVRPISDGGRGSQSGPGPDPSTTQPSVTVARSGVVGRPESRPAIDRFSDTSQPRRATGQTFAGLGGGRARLSRLQRAFTRGDIHVEGHPVGPPRWTGPQRPCGVVRSQPSLCVSGFRHTEICVGLAEVYGRRSQSA